LDGIIKQKEKRKSLFLLAVISEKFNGKRIRSRRKQKRKAGEKKDGREGFRRRPGREKTRQICFSSRDRGKGFIPPYREEEAHSEKKERSRLKGREKRGVGGPQLQEGEKRHSFWFAVKEKALAVKNLDKKEETFN